MAKFDPAEVPAALIDIDAKIRELVELYPEHADENLQRELPHLGVKPDRRAA